jgi:hypothetical protein
MEAKLEFRFHPALPGAIGHLGNLQSAASNEFISAREPIRSQRNSRNNRRAEHR